MMALFIGQVHLAIGLINAGFLEVIAESREFWKRPTHIDENFIYIILVKNWQKYWCSFSGAMLFVLI